MRISIHKDKSALGAAAAAQAAVGIRTVLERQESCSIILATGASQFDTLRHLIAEPGIDWSKVTVFHLDEYVGLPVTHPASFRKYLKERFADKVGTLAAFHYVEGDATDPEAECRRLGELIAKTTIEVACIGIGENGHIAFNDPPADFETEVPYLIVKLDNACRQQQMGEGWFPTVDDVPARAISMSVRQILKAKTLIVAVPDARKAQAVRGCVEEAVSPQMPATILKKHADCTLYLDEASASLLKDQSMVEVNA